MAKRKEVIIGLHNVFTPNTDNLYDISTFSYEQSVDENTILFAIADSEDVGKYITINGEPKIISENDNFIITDGIVFSGNGGGQSSGTPTVGSTYTGGTNIDITDNVISAKGYIFNETVNSFVEGSSTTSNTATGNYSHAEGYHTTATGDYSHAEGYHTTATDSYSHAEGHSTSASGGGSHAEGKSTMAIGEASHAEGNSTKTEGDYSHAEGSGTITKNEAEHAEGRYNVSNKTVLNNNGHAYIDLGLPSGLLWATQNVGAETPQDYGLYFSWGNVDGHAVDENGNVIDGYSFDRTTYTSTPGGQFTGNTLDTEHDAATAVMGGDWRMPTSAEAVELIENTDHYYIGEDGSIVAGPFNYETNVEDKGLDGSYLRSICFVKKDEEFIYNDRSNFIEFPFAGACIDSLIGGEGLNNSVWSSSADESDVMTAFGLCFDSDGYLYCGDSDTASHRYCGLSVRGVMSKQNNIYETISSIGIGTDETDRKNAFEVMQNGDVYINGIGDYDGKNLENVASVQAVISNLQEGVGGVVENQITYTGGNNININDGVISAKGYSYDNETEIVTIPGSLRLLSDDYATTSWINMSFSSFITKGVSFALGDSTIDLENTPITSDSDITTSGTISSANGFYETSDIRKKNVIDELPLDKAYELINNCQSIIYTLKDNVDKQQIGLIAQEVREFFPEIVEEDKDGYLSLDYSRLTVVLLRVLKDLIDRVSKLETK